MKVPDTDIDVRIGEPPEKITMEAHSAECRYCKGVVKMMRDIKDHIKALQMGQETT